MQTDIRIARASDIDHLVAIEDAVFLTDRISRRSFNRLVSAGTAAVLVAEFIHRINGLLCCPVPSWKRRRAALFHRNQQRP